MCENIPALIAEARERHRRTARHLPDPAAPTLVSRLADALESLSAPSGEDREALEEILFDENNYERVHFAGSFEDEFRPRKAAGAILAAGFRRLSPVTREALEPTADLVDQLRSIECYYGGDLRDWMRDAVKLAADRLSLPEPAEVEWEYGVEDNIAEGGIDEGYSSEERALSMAAYRTSRYVTPGARAWAVKRRPAGDWVPVKGTEQ